MNYKRFRIAFKSGRVAIINAFNPTEAKILAQAAEIKNGNDYSVLSVTEF